MRWEVRTQQVTAHVDDLQNWFIGKLPYLQKVGSYAVDKIAAVEWEQVGLIAPAHIGLLPVWHTCGQQTTANEPCKLLLSEAYYVRWRTKFSDLRPRVQCKFIEHRGHPHAKMMYLVCMPINIHPKPLLRVYTRYASVSAIKWVIIGSTI